MKRNSADATDPVDDTAPPDPGAAWMWHMRRGQWQQAWALADCALPARAHASCTHLPRHLQYVWSGAPLAGKHVLVRCYHGLGDTIQFIRYAPLLQAIAAQVTVWAQPALLRLLRDVEGVDRWLPLHDGAPEVDFDVDLEIMELPHVFRSTPETLPARVPYLHVAPMPLDPASARPRIGLVWKAGDWDDSRSIPLDLFAPLAALRKVDVFILQPGAAAAGWHGQFGTCPGDLVDLHDYARALRAMDLLVTIDSMPAHLAGALGVPTWTLLQADADWRWMQDRNDSPWYPGMRLFRQRRAGDWAGIIAEVVATLEQGVWRRHSLNAGPGD